MSHPIKQSHCVIVKNAFIEKHKENQRTLFVWKVVLSKTILMAFIEKESSETS